MVIRSARGNQSGAAAHVIPGSTRASASGAHSDFMPLIVRSLAQRRKGTALPGLVGRTPWSARGPLAPLVAKPAPPPRPPAPSPLSDPPPALSPRPPLHDDAPRSLPTHRLHLQICLLSHLAELVQRPPPATHQDHHQQLRRCLLA